MNKLSELTVGNLISKKEWNAPEIIDLDVNDTESSTGIGSDGGLWSNS